MSYENRPQATAGIGPVAINVPATIIRTDTFEVDAGGWAAGSGTTSARINGLGRGGGYALRAYRSSSTGTVTVSRTYTGLVIGASYV